MSETSKTSWNPIILDSSRVDFPLYYAYHPYPSFNEKKYAPTEDGVESTYLNITASIREAVEESSPLILCHAILDMIAYGKRISTWSGNTCNWFFDLKESLTGAGCFANATLWVHKKSGNALFACAHPEDDTENWTNLGSMYQIMETLLLPFITDEKSQELIFHHNTLTSAYLNEFVEKIEELRMTISTRPISNLSKELNEQSLSQDDNPHFVYTGAREKYHTFIQDLQSRFFPTDSIETIKYYFRLPEGFFGAATSVGLKFASDTASCFLYLQRDLPFLNFPKPQVYMSQVFLDFNPQTTSSKASQASSIDKNKELYRTFLNTYSNSI